MDDSSDTMHLDKAMTVMEYISRNIDTRPCWHCNIHPAQTASERNVFFLSRFHLLLLQSVSYSIPTTYCIFGAHPMTPDRPTHIAHDTTNDTYRHHSSQTDWNLLIQTQ